MDRRCHSDRQWPAGAGGPRPALLACIWSPGAELSATPRCPFPVLSSVPAVRASERRPPHRRAPFVIVSPFDFVVFQSALSRRFLLSHPLFYKVPDFAVPPPSKCYELTEAEVRVMEEQRILHGEPLDAPDCPSEPPLRVKEKVAKKRTAGGLPPFLFPLGAAPPSHPQSPPFALPLLSGVG